MKNNSSLTKYFYLFFILNIINITFEKTEFDIEIFTNKTRLTPLYFNSTDVMCPSYIPSLFNSLPLVKNGEYAEITKQHYSVIVENYVMKPRECYIYIGNVSNNIFRTYFGMNKAQSYADCYFGLSSGFSYGPKEGEMKDKNTTLDYLKITKIIDEKKFSFDKWDLNDPDYIKSKIHLGYSHNDFSSKNTKYIGTCEIFKEDNYWGCYFKQMIFNNQQISLKKTDGNYYKIYFSSEIYEIKFPDDFREYIINNGTCNFDPLTEMTTCKGLFKEDLFVPLKLSNDNMDITLEVDSLKRFNSWKSYDQDLIKINFDENIDYIIFPLSMFKNFHIQFDQDNNIVKFYSTDKNILHVKNKDPPKEEGSNVLTVFIVILIIILILGLGYGVFRFIRYKKDADSREINKFTRFEDEDDFKNNMDKKVF